jgi:Glucodextranase, domain B/FecR protein
MGERRERALFLAGLLILVGAGAAGYWLFLGHGSVPAAPMQATPAAPQPPDRLVVAAVSGPVTLRRGGAAGVPEPVRAGDELRPDDAVETGPGGTVQLAAGESYRVDLDELSTFAVKEITAELARFRLAEGLVSTSVREDARRAVEVEAGAGAVARTRGGDLRVAGGAEVAAVAVSRGEAELSSGGKAVVIRAGQQSMASRGGAPSEPSPIPSSLLLKVSWPEDPATNRRRLVVTGRTSPGAVVALGGRSVKVEPDGTFREVLVLHEGRQRIPVAARDAAGNRLKEEGPEILVDTKGAPAEFDTHSLWGSEGKPPTGGGKPIPSGPETSLDKSPQKRENRGP